MLILKTLALEPMHGYGIAVRLEQMSKGAFRLNAGSLFVAFRLQGAELIRSEWKATENSRRAKYCVLTDQVRKGLNSKTREWGRQVAAIARILEAS
jgi:DNA-binding PadR family transcriptional regulator